MEMIDLAISSLQDTEQIVLEGINWRVAVGDFWAVGGLHASGKSDLLATAAGIMRPARGRYRVFGQELGAGFEEDRLATRLRLGLVFEGGRLFHHLSVAENIALPLCYHGNRTTRLPDWTRARLFGGSTCSTSWPAGIQSCTADR